MDEFLDRDDDSDGGDSPGLSTNGRPYIPAETPYTAWDGQGPFVSRSPFDRMFSEQTGLPAVREMQARLVQNAYQAPRQEVAYYNQAASTQQRIQQQMEEEFKAMQQDILQQQQEIHMHQQRLMQQQIQQEMQAQIMQQFMACQMGYPPMQTQDGVVMVPVPVPVADVPPSGPFQTPPPGFKLVPEQPRVYAAASPAAAGKRTDPVVLELEKLLPGQFRENVKPQSRGQAKGATKKIFVGGLCPDSTAESLRNHFQQFGEIADSTVISEPGTKKCRGFGFVEFAHRIPDGLFDRQHIVDQRRCGVKPYRAAAAC
jgi:hypothetical protein